jgi:hypothetical protein
MINHHIDLYFHVFQTDTEAPWKWHTTTETCRSQHIWIKQWYKFVHSVGYFYYEFRFYVSLTVHLDISNDCRIGLTQFHFDVLIGEFVLLVGHCQTLFYWPASQYWFHYVHCVHSFKMGFCNIEGSFVPIIAVGAWNPKFTFDLVSKVKHGWCKHYFDPPSFFITASCLTKHPEILTSHF